MSLHVASLEERLAAVEAAIVGLSRAGWDGTPALKAVASDIRARMEIPRSNALGELERAIEKMKRTKTSLGYEQREMVAVAYVIIKKWPFIRQALELFGEETSK